VLLLVDVSSGAVLLSMPPLLKAVAAAELLAFWSSSLVEGEIWSPDLSDEVREAQPYKKFKGYFF